MVNREDNGAGLVIIILGIMAMVAAFILFLIKLSRFLFWTSILGFAISLLCAISFLFFYFFQRNDYYYPHEHGKYFFISILALFIFYLFIGIFYNVGYSETAIKTEMELMGYIEWYEKITTVLDISKIEDEIIQKSIAELCKDINYSCEDLNKGFGVYQEIVGIKSYADKVSPFLVGF